MSKTLPKLSGTAKRSNMDLSSRKQSILTTKPAPKYSRWKLMKTMVKGDFIGQEWVDLNTGAFNPPDEEMSLVSDGCEVIMMHRDLLTKYLRKEL